jgi:two-component system sensor histidine kinase MprB
VTLRARMTLTAAVAVAIAVVLAAGATYVLVRNQLRGEVDDALRERARAAARFDAGFLPSRPFPRIPGAPTARLGGAGGYLQLVDANGNVTRPASATVELPVTTATKEVAAGTRKQFFSDATIADTHVRILTAPLQAGTALQVVRPLDEVDRALSRLRLILIAVVAAGVTLAAMLGTLVTRTVLAPVRRLTSLTEDVSQTLDLSHRIVTDSNDEIGRLATSFNRMLEALEESVGAQRQLVADASHELRTPLASIRVNIELLGRQRDLAPEQRERLLATTIEQLDEMTMLVAEILELARGDERKFEPEPVRFDELVGEAVERARRDTPSVQVVAELQPTLVRGVPSRLARAVGNLLDNAAKWSPSGGKVEVELAGGELVVRDHGPGIDSEDLPHVFDRFYRARAARGKPGAGLGLAIVRQVAEAHGGLVTAENASDGGAVFRLRVPQLLVDAGGGAAS